MRAHKAWHSLPEYERALRDAPTALEAFARTRATPPPPPEYADRPPATEEEDLPCETPGFADEDSDDEGGGS